MVFYLPDFWLEGAVREYQAVGAEVAVVRAVAPQSAKVEVVAVASAEPLVDEVPDEAAKRARIAVEGVHILAQVAHTVTHGVLVFAEHNGFVVVVVATHCARPEVHPTGYISVAPVAFVMDGSGRVCPVGGVPFRTENVAVAGLVAERPKADACMVLVALNHCRHTFHTGTPPVVAALGQFVVCSVRLDICFVDNVDAVLVTDVVHAWVVRVVRHTQGVNVELFHQLHVCFHSLVTHHSAFVGVYLVAVYASEFDGLAVDAVAGDAV